MHSFWVFGDDASLSCSTCSVSLLLVFTLTQPQPTHAPVSHASGGSVPSSVWLKPQSRQMDDTQRFMSSSDSATRYQVRSSVFRSKTKEPSSSFLVKDRPASTSKTRQRDAMSVQLWEARSEGSGGCSCVSTCSHRLRLMVLIGRRDCWFL